MKTTMTFHRRFACGLTIAAALAVLGWVPITSTAQAKKGAEYQMNVIHTQAEAEALKPGDSMAMVCTKCKSVSETHVTTEKGHITVMTPGEKHLCPGCKSTITTVGTGKGAKDEVKHVCEKCGDDSVFCCATKPGSGPTKGMEKKE